MKICIDSDRTGLALKKYILGHLHGFDGFECLDLAAGDHEEYPDIAHRLAQEVAEGNFQRGILICGTGLGMAMMANKVSGVWAGTPQNVECARRMARSNNANVLTIGSEVTDHNTAKMMVLAWLETPFETRRNVQRMRELAP